MTPSAVGAMGARGDVEGLIRALAPGLPAEVRRAAAGILGDLVDRRAVDPLIEILGDREEQVRLAAVLSLAKIADPKAVPALLALLADADGDVRTATVISLGMIGDRSAVPALLTALSDRHTPVRDAVAWALGAMKDERAVRHLIRALSDPEWHVRMEAEWALLEIGQPAVDLLISALHDEGVRWKAAGVLVKIGAVSLEPLQRALQGTADPNIRQGGEWAVRKIADLKTKMNERRPAPRRGPPGM
ncbi:MAG TPA: HEAT repeat domain-containing protein [Methanomicrobiales archaeon]|nr:HEAT repeat domain-containing protein [Methanomicrobiales archaeon]